MQSYYKRIKYICRKLKLNIQLIYNTVNNNVELWLFYCDFAASPKIAINH